MKPKHKEEFVPRALREVWEWKDSIYQETKHLPTREALDYILKEAHKVAIEQGFVTSAPLKVAEPRAKYAAKRKQRAAKK